VNLMRGISKAAMLVSLVALGAYGARAQAPAGSDAKTSQSAGAVQSANPPAASAATPAPAAAPAAASPTAPAAAPAAAPDKTSTLMNLPERTGPSLEDKNRQEFEKKAGEQGAKLLLRSEPTDAEIYLNGLYVGHSPLLMVVAPGKYDVEMRGPRHETEHSKVGVMPKETQTVLLKLNSEYPGSISVRWPGQ
jgi:PEGA domain